MKNIIKDIEKKELKRVYLLYGEEKYLVRNMKNTLLTGTVAAGDTMNLSRFSGKGVEVKEIIQTCDTMPFFADYRVILLEDTGFLKNANEEMAAYIKDIPSTSVVIFVESEVDKRSKVYKQIKALGYVCECNRLNHSDLVKWVLKRLTKEKKKITKENMEYFLTKVGDDMDNIVGELEKLISYCMDQEVIGKEAIDQVCVSEITGRIFEMVDAIGSRNQEKALELYYDLVAVREPPLRILYMLTRQFNIMLQLKEMESKGISAAEMAKNMGIQSFIVNKTLKQCRNFKYKTVRRAVDDCLQMEESVKLGNMNEKMAVELIIVRYSKEMSA